MKCKIGCAKIDHILGVGIFIRGARTSCPPRTNTGSGRIFTLVQRITASGKMGKQSWKAGNMLNPVPAVMVSVADQNHRPNIITVAWAGTVCTNPPMVSISVRPSRYSYEIIEKTGEFVINLTNEKLAKACDYCGVVSGRDVDKFKKTGLTPVPVEHVKAPAIAESPVNIACRVVESHPLGSHTMFVAEVLGVTVDDTYLDETGKFDINGTGLIMYSHGEYFALGKKLGKFGYSVQKKKK